jgi:hypothetical protein
MKKGNWIMRIRWMGPEGNWREEEELSFIVDCALL